MTDRVQPKLLSFGAIGTLAETSEIQRECFNRAFREAGLDWEWSSEEYLRRLQSPGGAARIAAYADEQGQHVDAARLHAAKVALFADVVRRDGLTPRPGVVELLSAAKAEGIDVALATATGPETVAVVLEGLSPSITAADFAFIGDSSHAPHPKPAPDIHLAALRAVGVSAGEAVAVEDTPESAASAVAAGIMTYGFPGRAASGRAFPGTMAVLDRLDAVRLLALDPCNSVRPIMEREPPAQ